MTEVESVGFDIQGLKSRTLKELPFLLSRFQYGVAVKKLDDQTSQVPDANGN